jgi:hypothetical protein
MSIIHLTTTLNMDSSLHTWSCSENFSMLPPRPPFADQSASLAQGGVNATGDEVEHLTPDGAENKNT